MLRGLGTTGALLLLLCGVASAATPGVLRFESEGYGNEELSFSVGRGPASVILVRTFDGGRLELNDRSAPIRIASTDSPLHCVLHTAQSAVCRTPAPFPLTTMKIKGGSHNDVIDARGVLADDVELEGGGGNDTLLAPRHVPHAYDDVELVGGPGSNVIVGGPQSSVSYAQVHGRVDVDLARGFGTAPGEHDHLVRVPGVSGSQFAFNKLSGSRLGGRIYAGGLGNDVLTRSSHTEVFFAQPPGEHFNLHFKPTLSGLVRVPSRVRCVGFSKVNEVEPEDVLLGRCRTSDLGVHLPMRAFGSTPITVRPAAATNPGGVKVMLTAGTTVVGEASAEPSELTPCRLNAVGRSLLRTRRRLRVLVSETITPRSYPEQPWTRFTTVLTLRGA